MTITSPPERPRPYRPRQGRPPAGPRGLGDGPGPDQIIPEQHQNSSTQKDYPNRSALSILPAQGMESAAAKSNLSRPPSTEKVSTLLS